MRQTGKEAAAGDSIDSNMPLGNLTYFLEVSEVLRQRYRSLCRLKLREFDVWTGTFNINGKPMKDHESLSDWITDHLAVKLSGATCAQESKVNGLFQPVSGENYNGHALFVKAGDPHTWLRYCSDNTWTVSDTAAKLANSCAGWVHTAEAGLAHATDAKRWIVAIDGKHVEQPALRAEMAFGQESAREPDIYFFGFQEAVNLNAKNLILENDTNKNIILAKLRAALGPNYELVVAEQLVGILLACYIKRELRKEIKDLHVHRVGVGIMGVGGNKGAVAMGFRLFDSSIAVACAHLAAHQNNVAGRNKDFLTICDQIEFPAFEPLAEGELFPSCSVSDTERDVTNNPNRLSARYSEATASLSDITGDANTPNPNVVEKVVERQESKKKTKNTTDLANDNSGSFLWDLTVADISNVAKQKPRLFEYEHVFFVGDLNYRLACTDLHAITEAIMTNDLDWLVSHDQLLQEKAKGNIFEGFREADIYFLPTYKYRVGSTDYEYFKGSKKPANAGAKKAGEAKARLPKKRENNGKAGELGFTIQMLRQLNLDSLEGEALASKFCEGT